MDARADIFALGAMLAHVIGDTAPPALRAIAQKARDEAPDHRYQDVEALAEDLKRFSSGEPVGAYPESALERVVRVYRRYELPILLLFAYIVMRFVLLAWRGI